jgi:predicted GIY-YIG superfamily endonuclease
MQETENGLIGWVYILSCDDGDWFFGACEGSLQIQLEKHDRGEGGRKEMGKSILLWAQGAANLSAAEAMRDAIAAWPDERQEALVRGEIDPPGA